MGDKKSIFNNKKTAIGPWGGSGRTNPPDLGKKTCSDKSPLQLSMPLKNIQ